MVTLKNGKCVENFVRKVCHASREIRAESNSKTEDYGGSYPDFTSLTRFNREEAIEEKAKKVTPTRLKSSETEQADSKVDFGGAKKYAFSSSVTMTRDRRR